MNRQQQDSGCIPLEHIPTFHTMTETSGETPLQRQEPNYNFRDRFGRLHELQSDGCYYIDPEDGVPRKLVTQRATKTDTLINPPAFPERPSRGCGRGWLGIVFGDDSWVTLAARERRNRDRESRRQDDVQTLFGTSWSRTGIKNKSPLAMQLIYWIYSDVPPELIAPHTANDEEQSILGTNGSVAPATNGHTNVTTTVATVATQPARHNIKSWRDLWRYDKKTCRNLAGKYFVGTIVLTAMLIWPTTIEEPLRNGGDFDPVRYRDWDYPRRARNAQEEAMNADSHDDENIDQHEAVPTIDDDGVGPSGTNSQTRETRPWFLHRPQPVQTFHGDFVDFARRSLTNSSDKLLERSICLLPSERGAPWGEETDAWSGVEGWDIDPIAQVSGIVDDHTVILDGAYGATIHWGKLRPVAFSKRKTAWREALKWAIRLGAAYFLMAVILVATAQKSGNTTIKNPLGPPIIIHRPTSPALMLGIILLIFTLTVLICAPWAMLKLYRGKFWSTQGWFFGIEGCADLAEVEKCLFGCNYNRLKWSTNGSTLSRHRRGLNHNRNTHECLSMKPEACGWTQAEFELSRNSRGSGRFERLYTIVDTYCMEATLVWAELPPTAVFICGSEGGMKRAVLCSFDWRTNSFVRETVVRMKTMVLDKMSRVERFRIALSRPAPVRQEE